MSLMYLFDVLPWWLAAPLLQLGILVAGMALDETYVNRATILTGALALAVHSVVAGGTGFMVSIYLDAGLVIGAYGLYTYVTDAYVGNLFRIAAYFLYSPLAVFLVIIFPDIAFPIAIIAAGVANLKLMEYLDPVDPYYFGPESEAVFDDAVQDVETGAPESSHATSEDTLEDPHKPANSVDDSSDGPTHSGDPTPAGGQSTERGILPEFMRRL